MSTGLLESDGGIDAQQLKRKSTWLVVIKMFGSKIIEAASSSCVVPVGRGWKKDKNGWMRENIVGEKRVHWHSVALRLGVTVVEK
jgi:hypothetical protein